MTSINPPLPAGLQHAKSHVHLMQRVTVIPLENGKLALFTGPASFLCHQGDFTPEEFLTWTQDEYRERKISHEKREAHEKALREEQASAPTRGYTQADLNAIASIEIDDIDFDF